MIERVRFRNFKALRDSTLPLKPFTLIVGPNGSGKSTALQGLYMTGHGSADYDRILSAGEDRRRSPEVEVIIEWANLRGETTKASWPQGGGARHFPRQDQVLPSLPEPIRARLSGLRVYSLDPNAIASAVQITPRIEMSSNGANLAGVIERLRDEHPERFEALNGELARMIPEFDQILFGVPTAGHKSFSLRTREGQHPIPAADLSQGTLLALAILTICHLPSPPPVACFEEPDRGIHPRLLSDVRAAMYRLSYPQDFGENREPVQVIATTHSPYFLDLYRDHPEEVVIAEKRGGNVVFEPLAGRADIDEILKDAHLGDVWYSGVLGGVPIRS